MVECPYIPAYLPFLPILHPAQTLHPKSPEISHSELAVLLHALVFVSLCVFLAIFNVALLPSYWMALDKPSMLVSYIPLLIWA